jgi:hypothetical protein
LYSEMSYSQVGSELSQHYNSGPMIAGFSTVFDRNNEIESKLLCLIHKALTLEGV